MDQQQLAALVEHLAPGARLERSWALTGGVSAEVLALEVIRRDGTSERLVARWHTADEKLAANARVQYEVLQLARAAGLPVPGLRWLDADAERLPAPGFVMDFVEGSDAWPEDALEQMADTLLRIHRVPADALPGLEPRVAAPGRPPSAHRYLLHGDFWPGNLLWRDGHLAAVLDWEDAAIGDPLSDLAGARLELLWWAGPEAMERLTDLYLRRAALDPGELPHWEIFVGEAAAVNMGHWGWAPEREARARRLTTGFVEAARISARAG